MFQRFLAVVLVAFAAPVFAQGATEASVERLFSAMHVQQSIDQSYAMMDKMMKQGMAQALPANPTAEQRKSIEAASDSFAAVMKDELSWAKLRPGMVRVYSETFTEAEVLGIVAFYESPAGQAFVAKMPALMQKSMEVTQASMKDLVPRMKAAVEKAALDAKAAAPAPK